MKIIALLVLLINISSCSDLKKTTSENRSRTKNISSSKKLIEAKKNNSKVNISGVLSTGEEYEATPELDGFVIAFDPFIAKKDDIFASATDQIIGKLYNDKINDESHISIESNIDYTIVKGLKSRYRIVPFIESSGEISSIAITSII